MRITLPDGSEKAFEGPVTGLEVAQSIGPGLAQAAVAIEVNGEEQDLSVSITDDATVSILTVRQEAGLDVTRAKAD